MLGLAAAFLFAAQMLNFPVAAGTSGHLLGGVLAAVLLGPSAGLLAVAAVLIVQCLLFSDGGLLALGANLFNMGLVGTVGAGGLYALVGSRRPRLVDRVAAAAFAAWCSVVLAATACAAELAVSGAAPWRLVFPAMAGIHMLIGIGEAVITALVLGAVAATRPDLLADDPAEGDRAARPIRGFLVYSGLIALGLAVIVSPLASSSPDGLERVAEDLHFAQPPVGQPVVASPMPDYALPGIPSPVLATAAAGGVGAIVMFLVAAGLGRLVTPHDRPRPPAT